MSRKNRGLVRTAVSAVAERATGFAHEVARMTVDGWMNATTQVGSAFGRTSFTHVPDARLSLRALSDLYHHDAFAQRICLALPREATRRGFRVPLDDKDAETALKAKLEAIQLAPTLFAAWTWGRRDGGSLIFVLVDDGAEDLRQPLDWNNIRSVDGLMVIPRRQVNPAAWDRDPLAPGAHAGEPSAYRVVATSGAHSASVVIHASRCIRFDGTLTDPERKLNNQGWAESLLQLVYDKLQQFNATSAATSTLVQDASQFVISMKGLAQTLSADTEDKFKLRMRMIAFARGVARVLLIDAEEKAERVEVGALAGLADLRTKDMQELAGAVDMPVTILMGTSPAGMNATGESDTRGWYANVEGEQSNYLRPKIERVVRMILRASDGPTGGVEPPAWSVEFAPLWRMTDKEQADLRKQVADTDNVYITAGVLTPEEVLESHFRPDGWTAEYSVDLEARKLAAASGDAPEGEDPAAGMPAPEGPSIDEQKKVIDAVAAREIPRDTGVMLLANAGMDPEAADAVMGEVGHTFFTAPEPDHEAQMAALQTKHAELQRSHQGTQQYLSRVLEKNKAGELVVGSLIAKPPTGAEPGETLEEGDRVPVAPDDPEAAAAGGEPPADAESAGAAPVEMTAGGEPASDDVPNDDAEGNWLRRGRPE
jgi:phage-related protein (TIGR01555 family)